MYSTLIILAVTVAYVAGQAYILPGHTEKDPEFYRFFRQGNRQSDLTWNKKIGNGNIFGTLGGNDMGLYGKAGYKQEIFNDHRGKLEGQAYGTRVLSPNGDSSNMGGRLDFANDNAKAAIDISKQIHGKTNVQASGSGQWQLGTNTRLSAEGYVQKDLGPGRADIGLNAGIEHKF